MQTSNETASQSSLNCVLGDVGTRETVLVVGFRILDLGKSSIKGQWWVLLILLQIHNRRALYLGVPLQNLNFVLQLLRQYWKQIIRSIWFTHARQKVNDWAARM